MSCADRPVPAEPALQPPPPEAAAVFGERYDLAQAYAGLLCTVGVERGLIGPREPERIWSRHLLNAAALASWVPAGSAVVDLGSGAGLPGIPLLLARPDLTMTLVEPMARRVRFCEEVRELLGLPARGLSLSVLRARAEQAPRASADVVVARAVAPLERLVGLAMPLLRPGGRLLALKGERAVEEIAAARVALAHADAGEPQTHEVGLGPDRTYVVVVAPRRQALR